MIVQIEETLFVTPEEGCQGCDGTGVVWLEREVNATEECPCITRQLDEHENPFAHYEIIDAKHEIYNALIQLEKFHDKSMQPAHTNAWRK